MGERLAHAWTHPQEAARRIVTMTNITIMVDDLQVWPHATGIFRAGSCHLTVDGESPEHIEALHAFAKRIGLKRSWYQDHLLAPHYDLVKAKRDAALAEGAVYVHAIAQARQRQARRRKAAKGTP